MNPTPAKHPAAAIPVAPAAGTESGPAEPVPPREFGGRKDGTDPTRFGDWEKNGRCVDF